LAVMKAHQAHADDNPAMAPLGGDIILTTVRQDGVDQRVIGCIGDREALAIAGAAVTARHAREGDSDLDTAIPMVADLRANTVASTDGNRAERRRQEKLAGKTGRRAA